MDLEITAICWKESKLKCQKLFFLSLFFLVSLSLVKAQDHPDLAMVRSILTQVMSRLEQVKQESTKLLAQEKILQAKLTLQATERKSERESLQAKLSQLERELQESTESLESAKTSYSSAWTSYQDEIKFSEKTEKELNKTIKKHERFRTIMIISLFINILFLVGAVILLVVKKFVR